MAIGSPVALARRASASEPSAPASNSRCSASATRWSRVGAGGGLGDEQGGAGLADRTAEVLPHPPGLLGDRRRCGRLGGRLEQQRLGDSRAILVGLPDAHRLGGSGDGLVAASPAQGDPSCGGEGVGHRHRRARDDGALGRLGGSRRVVGDECLGEPDQRRHEALHVAAALGQLERLAVEGDRLGALAAQQLDVAELGEGVGHVVGAQSLPELLSPVQVAEGVVEATHAQVVLAAVVVGETDERLRSDQLGDLDRPVELADRLLVVALLAVVAAAVRVDPHELEDVACALGVVEGAAVLLGVGPPVALDRRHHRLGRVQRRQGGVVAGLVGGDGGAVEQRLAPVDVGTDPPDGRPPRHQLRLLRAGRRRRRGPARRRPRPRRAGPRR